MSAFSSLERLVLTRAVRDDPERAALERQLALASVAAREATGVGFYTHFHLPDSVEPLTVSRLVHGLPDAHANHPALEAGAEFILHIHGGRICCLEGYTNTGEWPADETLFQIV